MGCLNYCLWQWSLCAVPLLAYSDQQREKENTVIFMKSQFLYSRQSTDMEYQNEHFTHPPFLFFFSDKSKPNNQKIPLVYLQ